MRGVLLTAAFGLFGLAGVAAAAEQPPYKTMRAMQALEDRVASGDALAQAARGKAVARLGLSFAGMDSETWRDLRNGRALVIYLFGGGDAVSLARAIPPEAVHKDVAALYRGALAYSGGDDDSARTLLLPVDAKSLPTGLAGHLALVQAALVAPTDKPRAVALLDLARLLEPGTLVEEAALRKEMSLFDESGNFDKLNLLERRYQSAFSASVYAENFRQLVGEMAARAGDENSVAGNLRLVRLLAPIGRDARLRVLLAIARREMLAGHASSAAFAALEASKLSAKASPDAARADLYFGASAIVGERYEAALAALSKAEPERLDGRDQILRTAALDMAAILRAGIGAAPAAISTGDTALVARGDAGLIDAAAAIASVK